MQKKDFGAAISGQNYEQGMKDYLIGPLQGIGRWALDGTVGTSIDAII